MPTPIFLEPGQSATTISLNEKRPRCLILLLLLAMPFVFCLGINIPALIANAQKPSPSPTATITPTETATPTGTITPRPTMTPPPTRTPTVLMGSVYQVAKPTYVPTNTLSPTITPTATPCVLYYRVRAGDNVSVIAARYRVRTSAILRSNSIPNPDLLYVGRILKIPACPVALPSATITPTATPGRRAFDEK
jgi:LysM repeat protein